MGDLVFFSEGTGISHVGILVNKVNESKKMIHSLHLKVISCRYQSLKLLSERVVDMEGSSSKLFNRNYFVSFSFIFRPNINMRRIKNKNFDYIINKGVVNYKPYRNPIKMESTKTLNKGWYFFFILF